MSPNRERTKIAREGQARVRRIKRCKFKIIIIRSGERQTQSRPIEQCLLEIVLVILFYLSGMHSSRVAGLHTRANSRAPIALQFNLLLAIIQTIGQYRINQLNLCNIIAALSWVSLKFSHLAPPIHLALSITRRFNLVARRESLKVFAGHLDWSCASNSKTISLKPARQPSSRSCAQLEQNRSKVWATTIIIGFSTPLFAETTCNPKPLFKLSFRFKPHLRRPWRKFFPGARGCCNPPISRSWFERLGTEESFPAGAIEQATGCLPRPLFPSKLSCGRQRAGLGQVRCNVFIMKERIGRFSGRTPPTCWWLAHTGLPTLRPDREMNLD